MSELEALKSENEKLKQEKEELEALKGKMGREIGELRAKQSLQNNADSVNLSRSSVNEENYDADEEVRVFAKNPKGYIKNHINGLMEIVDKQNKTIQSLQNNQNYMLVIKKYPEFENIDFQKKVLDLQAKEKAETGRDIDTVFAIEKVKLLAREEEIAKKEENLKKMSSNIRGEKLANFGGMPGSGSSGGTERSIPDKDIGEQILANIEKYKSNDKAPF